MTRVELVSHRYQRCVIAVIRHWNFVVLTGFEPMTSWMSTKRSNQLSYKTISIYPNGVRTHMSLPLPSRSGRQFPSDQRWYIFRNKTRVSTNFTIRYIYLGLEPRAGFEPAMFVSLITSEVESTAVPSWRKWRKVLKVVYTEGIEPSLIVFKTIVLTISRSNTFNYHPFEVLTGFEPVWVVLQTTAFRLMTPLGHSTLLLE